MNKKFLPKLALILFERLQPGFSKHSMGVYLFAGSCDFVSFDTYFGNKRNVMKTRRKFYNTIDGKSIPEYKYIYKWDEKELATLFEKEVGNWACRHHGDGNGKFGAWVKSTYTSLTLAINEKDDRVFYKFSQVTEHFDKLKAAWIVDC